MVIKSPYCHTSTVLIMYLLAIVSVSKLTSSELLPSHSIHLLHDFDDINSGFATKRLKLRFSSLADIPQKQNYSLSSVKTSEKNGFSPSMDVYSSDKEILSKQFVKNSRAAPVSPVRTYISIDNMHRLKSFRLKLYSSNVESSNEIMDVVTSENIPTWSSDSSQAKSVFKTVPIIFDIFHHDAFEDEDQEFRKLDLVSGVSKRIESMAENANYNDKHLSTLCESVDGSEECNMSSIDADGLMVFPVDITIERENGTPPTSKKTSYPSSYTLSPFYIQLFLKYFVYLPVQFVIKDVIFSSLNQLFQIFSFFSADTNRLPKFGHLRGRYVHRTVVKRYEVTDDLLWAINDQFGMT